jgi:ribonucleoside-diphosphate reductase alpha chain
MQTVNVIIKDGSGNVVFERNNVEAPESWSQQAIDIAASKFFTKDETSIYHMVERVVRAICIKQPWVYEVIPTFEEDLRDILLGQRASFNSPVWFNLGVDERSALSACFILGIDDNLDSIFENIPISGNIFKAGGGCGINWSRLRGKNELLSKGGRASGVLSFFGGYDTFAGIIKSGGKTRRAANMAILADRHPDIMEFVKFKAKEERKLRDLIDTGNWGSPYDMESEAAQTVKGTYILKYRRDH